VLIILHTGNEVSRCCLSVHERAYLYVCVCKHARASVCACARVCVCATSSHSADDVGCYYESTRPSAVITHIKFHGRTMPSPLPIAAATAMPESVPSPGVCCQPVPARGAAGCRDRASRRQRQWLISRP
jgi:hypothetical protein